MSSSGWGLICELGFLRYGIAEEKARVAAAGSSVSSLWTLALKIRVMI